ncbi:hypothetical protein F53441_12368 [Fusarium austroafricanum]|uniref:Uncharacterized protein n=1 Tax=Fusarium austroafricanum TaxID=2364996 RepID=A0A8H4JYL0_9HYPO|nr:hypothetical protein F53441_12368 [Fusarium austroafricanum]
MPMDEGTQSNATGAEQIDALIAQTRQKEKELGKASHRFQKYFDRVIHWLDKFKGIGDVVSSFDPVHAALPWAAFRTGVMKWTLSENEQKVAVERINRDRVSLPDADHSVWAGLIMAAKDLRTWIFVIRLTANHSAYSFNSFFPTIVKGFDLGNTTLTLILTSLPYLVAAIVDFATAWSLQEPRIPYRSASSDCMHRLCYLGSHS